DWSSDVCSSDLDPGSYRAQRTNGPRAASRVPPRLRRRAPDQRLIGFVLLAEAGEHFEHEVDLARGVVVGDSDPQRAARVHELEPGDQLGRVMVALGCKDL